MKSHSPKLEELYRDICAYLASLKFTILTQSGEALVVLEGMQITMIMR